MLFFDYLKNELQEFTLRFWSEQEKLALLKVLHEIYVADHEFSKGEMVDFIEKAKKLDVNDEGAAKMSMQEALDILSKDKLKNDFIYMLMAEAVFKDNDYDELEHAFVDRLVETHQVSRVNLDHHIRQIQEMKMDEVMANWIKEIDQKEL